MIVVAAVAGSAVVTKQYRAAPPLAVVVRPDAPLAAEPSKPKRPTSMTADGTQPPEPVPAVSDPSSELRWFNRRPVRPARVVWLTVTAYSPDARSCAPFDDGRTATLHSVWTNAMKLVAADTDLYPFGTLMSVPGYDKGRIVPVLDRGAAIRGARLDVLMATHSEARAWGTRELPVVIWEYADGLPADDPREFR